MSRKARRDRRGPKALWNELESLLQAGATNVKSYCMTNELSLHSWADLRKDMPLFRAYHQALYDELHKRGVPIRLLATDASPVANWNTIQWASENMDDITGVYGGHHYFNQFLPDNPDFYPWFLEKSKWAADLARSKGKDFILGEFGPAQGAEARYGYPWATSRFYDSPQEPLAGIQLVEGAMAAINGGIYGLAYWSFSDEPDEPKGKIGHRWGLFRWMTAGATTRTPYYAYGLLAKFFHGPAAVHQVESADPWLRVAAIQNEATRTWSVAVINRHKESATISLELPQDPGKPFRRYLYDPAHVPVTDDGDLQGPTGRIALTARSFEDTIPPASLAVYTTAYEDRIPSPPKGLQLVLIKERDWKTLRWEADRSVIYYRIYQDNVRIGSTTTNEYVDAGPRRNEPGDYTVVAVDQYGNSSRPQRALRPTSLPARNDAK